MKCCEFKECTFEDNLNRELSLHDMLIFPSNKVLEKKIGFDAAIVSRDWRLFRMFRRFGCCYFPLMFCIPRGIELDKSFWSSLSLEIKNMPIGLKFNVFLQHKLPVYFNRCHWKIEKQWIKFNTPYFRYAITEHQHEILLRLENLYNNSAIVCYSAPAFYTFEDLINFTQGRELVNKSNFAQPSKIGQHKAYAYNQPGNKGVGFSESEDIESYNITEKIKELLSSSSEEKDNLSFINETAEVIEEVMKTLKEENILSGHYKVLKEKVEVPDYNLAKSFKIFYAFSYVTDIYIGFGVTIHE